MKGNREKKGEMLLKACENGNIFQVYDIINSSSLNNDNIVNYTCMKTYETPLHTSFEYGHKDIFKLLLLNGAEPTTPIKNLSFVKCLIENNVDVNKRYGRKKETMLHKACEEGNEDIIRYLLTVPNINVNTKDRYSLTCLHTLLLDYICVYDDSDEKKKRLFHLLLDTNLFDLNCVDNRGFTLEECLDFDNYYLEKLLSYKSLIFSK